MENGFQDSPIKLNTSLKTVEVWNEQAIMKRAKDLSKQALEIWASPKLTDDVLSTYQPDPKAKSNYTIDDHPFLSPLDSSFSPETKILFDTLRREILALDPVVIEEYLKRYIAFKAETNFVDIIPQSKSLKLVLNMPFSKINDPKNMCTDITNIGSWGNGDISVKFSDIKDLPYIMGLIRQSFELQMNE